MPITITEALAEIKTVGKRIEKKRETMGSYLARQEGVRDPLEKEGGSERFLAKEMQAVRDLEARVVSLRRGIQRANDDTKVTINGETRTISDWLSWRRDVAPNRQKWLNHLRGQINGIRDQAKRQGASIVNPAAGESKPTDVVINVSEVDLAKEIEALEDTLGQLDGQLSLKNATVLIVE